MNSSILHSISLQKKVEFCLVLTAYLGFSSLLFMELHTIATAGTYNQWLYSHTNCLCKIEQKLIWSSLSQLLHSEQEFFCWEVGKLFPDKVQPAAQPSQGFLGFVLLHELHRFYP